MSSFTKSQTIIGVALLSLIAVMFVGARQLIQPVNSGAQVGQNTFQCDHGAEFIDGQCRLVSNGTASNRESDRGGIDFIQPIIESVSAGISKMTGGGSNTIPDVPGYHSDKTSESGTSFSSSGSADTFPPIEHSSANFPTHSSVGFSSDTPTSDIPTAEEIKREINQLNSRIAELEQMLAALEDGERSGDDLGIGIEITTIAALSVRSTPNGERIATVPNNTTGTIVDGPVVTDTDAWWKVQYNYGMFTDRTTDQMITGWSVEEWLQPKKSNAGRIVVTGVLDSGVECPIVKTDSGTVYSISERNFLQNGSLVEVSGAVAPISNCMQGEHIIVDTIISKTGSGQ